jgi:hypothetical protein
MKNHWLRLNQQKRNRFWTAEFSRLGTYLLRPRRADVLDASRTVRHATSGHAAVSFAGGMVNSSDKELIDFVIECRKGMDGWVCRLRYYASLLHELEYFELTDLSSPSVGMGVSFEDIKVGFAFQHLQHVRV